MQCAILLDKSWSHLSFSSNGLSTISRVRRRWLRPRTTYCLARSASGNQSGSLPVSHLTICLRSSCWEYFWASFCNLMDPSFTTSLLYLKTFVRTWVFQSTNSNLRPCFLRSLSTSTKAPSCLRSNSLKLCWSTLTEDSLKSTVDRKVHAIILKLSRTLCKCW